MEGTDLVIHLFGGRTTGITTQANLLHDWLGYPVVNTRQEAFAEAQKRKSERSNFGKWAHEEKGKQGFITPFIEHRYMFYRAKQGYFLDGPWSEGVVFDGYFKVGEQAKRYLQRGLNIDLCFFFDLSAEERSRRYFAQCEAMGWTQRTSRKEWGFRQHEDENLLATAEELSSAGVQFIPINASESIEAVHQKIVSEIVRFAKAKRLYLPPAPEFE